QANIKDFGYGDLQDILAGMDVLEKRFPIDKDREGLTGWSYGGFMTMFGVTRTPRFRAAVAGAGISDWKSYYGENSIDQWIFPFFGPRVSAAPPFSAIAPPPHVGVTTAFPVSAPAIGPPASPPSANPASP